MSNPVQVYDESNLKKYRIEIPNMLCDMELTPFELSLYLHLKRIAGGGEDGKCFRGLRGLAKLARMSLGQAHNAKAVLQQKGLIRIEKKDPKLGQADIIYIIDVWRDNFQKYAPVQTVHQVNSPVHMVNAPVHCMNTPVHMVNTEERTYIKKEPNKKEPKTINTASLSLADESPSKASDKIAEDPNPTSEPIISDPKDPLLHAFLELFEAAWDLFEKKDWAIMQNFVKPFRKISATPEQVKQFGEWFYQHHWRGQQGQKPEMIDVKKNWKTAFLPPKPIVKKESQYESNRERNARNLSEAYERIADPNFAIHLDPIAASSRIYRADCERRTRNDQRLAISNRRHTG